MNYLIKENYNNVNWIDYFIHVGELSSNLKNSEKNEIEKNLIILIHNTLCFAKQNDINMNSSWRRWVQKSDYKHYY